MDACCCKCVRVEVVESRVDVNILGPSTVSYDQSEYVPMQTAQYPEYEGDYEADALFSEQTFATAHKSMRQDFTVHAINYTEAPNDYGTTVTIGG